MKLNLRKVRGLYLYERESDEPCGTIKSVIISKDKGTVTAFLVDTLSLVPISKTVLINQVEKVEDKKLYLKDGNLFKDMGVSSGNDRETVLKDNTLAQKSESVTERRINDMRFDFETGEITDITISKGFLGRKDKIPVNKIRIKDNTIIIE